MQVLPPDAFSLHMDSHWLCLKYHTQHMDIHDWEKTLCLASIPSNYDESYDRCRADLANDRTHHVDKHGRKTNVKVKFRELLDFFFFNRRRRDVANLRKNYTVKDSYYKEGSLLCDVGQHNLPCDNNHPLLINAYLGWWWVGKRIRFRFNQLPNPLHNSVCLAKHHSVHLNQKVEKE